mgnify:CR=1 FL=1
MKFKNTFIVTLILIIVTYIMAFIMPINANAVFTNDFDVTWTNNGTTNIGSGSTNSMNGSFSKIIDKYKTAITFISAIGAVTMVAIFILNFMKLGTTSGNPTERSKCITGLIWSGIAAAGLGSVALVVGIFYGALRD